MPIVRLLSLAALAAWLLGLARAEEPTAGQAASLAPFSDDPGLVQPLRTGERGLVLRTDGTALEGRVVVIAGGSASVRVDSPRRTRHTPPATIVTIPLASIRGFVPLVGSGTAGRGPEVRVVLADGSVIGGRLLEQGPGRLVLGRPGEVRELAAGATRSVHDLELLEVGAGPVDANLEVPSAFLPAPGALRVASLRGVHLVGNAGVAPHLALEVGTAVPLLHAAGYGRNGQLALRASFSPLPGLAVGGGLHLEAMRPGHYAGRLSATITARLQRFALTLHAGPTFAGGDELSGLGAISVAAAAAARLTDRVAVLGEAWLSSRGGDRDGLVILAGRYHYGRLTLDGGLTLGAREGKLGPWLGVGLDLGRRG